MKVAEPFNRWEEGIKVCEVKITGCGISRKYFPTIREFLLLSPQHQQLKRVRQRGELPLKLINLLVLPFRPGITEETSPGLPWRGKCFLRFAPSRRQLTDTPCDARAAEDHDWFVWAVAVAFQGIKIPGKEEERTITRVTG